MAFSKKAALCTTAAFLTLSYEPARAQDADTAMSNDIIVTAQRVEQRLQDVPISITVLDQSKLDNNNISNLRDIASLTPGFSVNSRYGADNSTFTIRGFFQEQRSFATVGVFFADVVAPRGSGATFGGDGAGPGALFDLQNLQVLKGPQGTLFGRNVTGGAVLLVPRKPTDKLEGYVEGSAGNYDMRRVQGVLNIPLSDTFRVRAGVDHLDRRGYLKNAGNFGDGYFGNRGMGDTNYWTARLSLVADLTPDLENYTIATYTHSKSNGVIPKVIRAIPGSPSNQAFFGNESAAQVAHEDQLGFWTVSNKLPDSRSETKTWQVINTLTWRASDSLTVKNILSYGELRGHTNLDLFGAYALFPGASFGSETLRQVRGFAFTHDAGDAGYTNAQSSFVGELQLQGRPGDGTFTWQAGAYVEINDPLGLSGVQTASFTACANVLTYDCVPAAVNGGPTFPAGVGAGTIAGGTGALSLQKTRFRDYALYAQGSYKLTNELTLTAGIRYTWDKMRTFLRNQTVVFQAVPSNVRFGCTNFSQAEYTGVVSPTANAPYTLANHLNHCAQDLRKDTSAPTWLINLDYKPIDGVMVYGKWARGYRQGGLAIFGPDPLQDYDKETVDSFEVGAKTNWRGAMPGSVNITGYYNDLRNQQLQLSVSCDSTRPGFTFACGSNATIINAGKSRIWGIEAEAALSPFNGMNLSVAYGYINARILDVAPPTVIPPFNVITALLAPPCSGEQCNTIANSGPPHQVVASANYTLPLPSSVGRITLGGTFVYQSRRRLVTDAPTALTAQGITSGVGVAPSSSVLNLNATWENVAQMPVDLSFFMTNVTNERVFLTLQDNTPRGFVSGIIGEPQMWGFRLRYRFGQ